MLRDNPDSPSRLQRWLALVERAGNALPHPATLFAVLAALVVVLSWILHLAEVTATHPTSGEVIKTVNLLSVPGLQRMIQETVRNFLSFPPLGISLVALLGLGIAEHTGLIGAALRLVVITTPAKLITPMVVLAGVISNAGSEVGYVLLTPLAAALFHALGRHPLAGLAAAFSGVSGGYSANVLIGSVDVLLAGLSQAAAQIVNPAYQVSAAANWYFMGASTFVITIVGTWITEKIVTPRLGQYKGAVPRERLQPITCLEKRGLYAAASTLLLLVVFVLVGVLPEKGYLIHPANPAFAKSVFMEGLVTFIMLAGLLPGVAYGIAAGTLKNDHDLMAGMTRTMQTMGAFIVLAFFAAQFIAYFSWTNIGVIGAIRGSEVIQRIGLQDNPVILMLSLVAFAASINLFISSASAKWSLLAPIFVPMFMLLGYSPELVQGAYRVGDSVTNIITPLMSYFPLILTFVQRYDSKAGVGTLIATMLPYSVAFLISWMTLLGMWILLGIPMGPGAPLTIRP